MFAAVATGAELSLGACLAIAQDASNAQQA
jgi:hypothetical protein